VKSGKIATAVCLFSTILSAFAQEKDPLKTSWSTETALLATGISAQILGQYRLKQMATVRSIDLQKSDLPPWDRFAAGWYNPAASTTSDVLVFVVGGAMIYSDLWDKTQADASWKPLLEDGLILGEAFAWSSALNLNVRAFRIHPRPFVYDTTNGSSASERNAPEAAGSFYSGHASEAFLGAAYFATVYPLRHPEFKHTGWLWAGAMTAASGVATLRVVSGKHFPSDVIAGAAVGTALGWGFATLHQRYGKDSETGWQFNAWPQVGGVAIQAVKPLAAW
jgi:membrane-associated phospholipid phosphatase